MRMDCGGGFAKRERIVVERSRSANGLVRDVPDVSGRYIRASPNPVPLIAPAKRRANITNK